MSSNSQTSPKDSGTAPVSEVGHGAQASTDGDTKRAQAVDGKESLHVYSQKIQQQRMLVTMTTLIPT